MSYCWTEAKTLSVIATPAVLLRFVETMVNDGQLLDLIKSNSYSIDSVNSLT